MADPGPITGGDSSTNPGGRDGGPITGGGSSTNPIGRSAAEQAEKADGGPFVGGPTPAAGTENDVHVNDLARFAVQEHNNRANAMLRFERVVKVRKQAVAGTLYFFTIEVTDGGVKKLYEAKVWEKLWENFKSLQEFKPASA